MEYNFQAFLNTAGTKLGILAKYQAPTSSIVWGYQIRNSNFNTGPYFPTT